MEKSLQLMQRRNNQQNKIIEEQTRAISKLYSTVNGFITAWEQPHTRTWELRYQTRVEIARALLKEIKL